MTDKNSKQSDSIVMHKKGLLFLECTNHSLELSLLAGDFNNTPNVINFKDQIVSAPASDIKQVI